MSNDFTEMARKVGSLPEWIETAVDAEIGDVFDTMAASARRNIIEQGSLATTELATSIRHISAADEVRGKTGYTAHAVRAGTPYAAYVEYGTGLRQRGSPSTNARFTSPSTPPTGAIVEWMREKNVPPRISVEGMDDTRAAAQAIASSIARYGQRPHPYMRPAWQQHRQQISRAHARGVRKALRRL